MTFRSLAFPLSFLALGTALGIGLDRNVIKPRASTESSGASASASPSAAAQNSHQAAATSYSISQRSGSADSDIASDAAEARGRVERWLARTTDGEYPLFTFSSICTDLDTMARADPQGALAFIQNAERFPRRAEACGTVLAIICANSADGPEQTVAWLRANLPASAQQQALECMMNDLRQAAPEQAINLSFQNGVKVMPYQRAQALAALADTSPSSAIRYFEQLPAAERAQAAPDIARAWLSNDSTAAINWCISQRSTDYGANLIGDLIPQILAINPGKEIETLQRLAVTPAEIDSAFYRIAHDSPALAIELLSKAPADQVSLRVNTVIREIFSENPTGALDIASIYLPAEERDQTLANSWSDWARSDRKAADAWLATLPDSNTKTQIQRMAMLEDNPVELLNSLSSDTSVTPPAEIVSRALTYINENNARDAIDWLINNPDQLTSSRLATTLRYCDDNASQLVLDRIDAIPAGAPRDTALSALAQTWIERGEPDLAATAIPALRDTGRQTALQFQVYLSKRQKDETEATAWLSSQTSVTTEMQTMWSNIASGFTLYNEECGN